MLEIRNPRDAATRLENKVGPLAAENHQVIDGETGFCRAEKFRPVPISNLLPERLSLYSSSMKLIFLHGSPAAGKLTVARALLRMVSGRLFDNHAAIDLARTVFDFGAPGFWELVHRVRTSTIETAAEHGVSLVVTTFCYAEPDDLAQFREFEEILRRHNGELLPVYLYCSREEAGRRVGNPDRVERRKMTSQESLIRDLDKYNFSPVPRSDCLRLDTEIRSADLNAQEIVRRFGLVAGQNY
jgi:hypothetical protein